MTGENELIRRLKKRDYSDLAAAMSTELDSYRRGEISPYELCSAINAAIVDCGWTVEEVREYEKQHGIIWSI